MAPLHTYGDEDCRSYHSFNKEFDFDYYPQDSKISEVTYKTQQYGKNYKPDYDVDPEYAGAVLVFGYANSKRKKWEIENGEKPHHSFIKWTTADNNRANIHCNPHEVTRLDIERKIMPLSKSIETTKILQMGKKMINLPIPPDNVKYPKAITNSIEGVVNKDGYKPLYFKVSSPTEFRSNKVEPVSYLTSPIQKNSKTIHKKPLYSSGIGQDRPHFVSRDISLQRLKITK